MTAIELRNDHSTKTSNKADATQIDYNRNTICIMSQIVTSASSVEFVAALKIHVTYLNKINATRLLSLDSCTREK
jgi:hypothetical protein